MMLLVLTGLKYMPFVPAAVATALVEEEEPTFVRRKKKQAVTAKQASDAVEELEPVQQFVRRENPEKLKGKDGLPESLMLEICIAFFGFLGTAMVQSYRRMRNRKLRPPKAPQQARSTSKDGQPATIGQQMHGIPQEAIAASKKRELMEERADFVETEADALKKVARAISSTKPENVARLLQVSLSTINDADMPKANGKTTMDGVMALIRSCSGSRCYLEAIAVYLRFEDRIGRGSRQLWSLLLYCGTEAGDFSSSEQFYWKLREVTGSAGPSGRDLVNIIRKYARQKDAAGLSILLEDLKDVASHEEFDRLIRNRALAACHKEGATELAEHIASSSIFGEPLDTVAYNTLISCYCKSRQFEKCFATFESMECKGIVPTQSTFGSLMEACVSAEDWERAKEIPKKLSSYGISMNAQHCTILVKGLVKQKRLMEAEDLLKGSSMTLDVVAFYTLLRAYTDEGDSDGAERVFQDMFHKAVLPDEYCCNAMIHSCTITKASSVYITSLLERSIAAGVAPSATTLSLMLKAFALSDDFDAGLRLLESSVLSYGISTTEPRLFVQLAQAAIKAGKKETALAVHQAMVKALDASSVESHKAASKWLLRQCERA
jgi:pentatricopeptide repeat protein